MSPFSLQAEDAVTGLLVVLITKLRIGNIRNHADRRTLSMVSVGS